MKSPRKQKTLKVEHTAGRLKAQNKFKLCFFVFMKEKKNNNNENRSPQRKEENKKFVAFQRIFSLSLVRRFVCQTKEDKCLHGFWVGMRECSYVCVQVSVNKRKESRKQAP